MVLLTLKLSVMETTRHEVLRALRGLCGPTSALHGCRAAHVYSRCDEPGCLLVVEEWDTRASLESHVHSPDFQRMLGSMDLASAPPELRIHEVGRVSGLEGVRSLNRDPEA